MSQNNLSRDFGHQQNLYFALRTIVKQAYLQAEPFCISALLNYKTR